MSKSDKTVNIVLGDLVKEYFEENGSLPECEEERLDVLIDLTKKTYDIMRNEKEDPKQWIPIAGLYFAYNDFIDGKPSIFFHDQPFAFKSHAYMTYQTFTGLGATLGVAVMFLEYLF